MQQVLQNGWGNPSSGHGPGLAAREILDGARKSVARLIQCDLSQVIFTSGGTEANGLALWSAHLKGPAHKNRIIVSTIEHPSVSEAVTFFTRLGREVVTCPVDDKGALDLKQFEKRLDDRTLLCAVMLANNEIGTIQPIQEAAALAHQAGALFLTDGVQALGKIPVSLPELGMDYLSFSAHKIYGPKGVGCLCIRRGAPVANPLKGGGQEGGGRSGTENVPGIAGFGEACHQLSVNPMDHERIRMLRDGLAGTLQKETGAFPVGDLDNGLPNTLGVVFPGVDAQALLMSANRQGLYLSAGSACHSGKTKISPVLHAIGLRAEHAQNFVRISLGAATSEQDIQYAASVLLETVQRLR